MDELTTIQSLNPWKSLWLKPRQTIQQIVNTNPTLHVIPIMFVAGIGHSLTSIPNDLENSFFKTNALFSEIPVPILVLVSLILGGILSIIFLYVNAWLLEWTGNWLDGHASRRELRSAMAWSNVPNLVQIVIWLPFLFLFGSEVFANDFQSQLAGGIIESPLVITITVIALILSIWSMFLCCQMIGEVQGFSAWTAAWNYILVLLVYFLAMIILAIIFGIISAIIFG